MTQVTDEMQGGGVSLTVSFTLSESLTDLVPIKKSNVSSEDDAVKDFMAVSPRRFFFLHQSKL